MTNLGCSCSLCMTQLRDGFLSEPPKARSYFRMIFALTAIFILIGNTFSPQYLIWLLPFAAWLTVFEGAAFLLIVGMTYMFFWFYPDVYTLQTLGWLVILRNAMLLALAVKVLVSFFTEGGKHEDLSEVRQTTNKED